MTGRSTALFAAAALAEGSLLWGILFDGFKPDRYDLAGATICLVGVGVIMFTSH